MFSNRRTNPYAPLASPDRTEEGCSLRKCLQIGCCTVIVLVIAVYGYLIWMAQNEGTAGMLTLSPNVVEYCTPQDAVDMRNVTDHIWWPGCGYVTNMKNFTDGCLEPCVDSQVMFDMQKMNQELRYKSVSYPSREAPGITTVQLNGLWLPADTRQFPGPAPRPRIVVQHGFKANMYEFRAQFIAFILRSLGFDVLLNNFRDHCYSDQSAERVFHWGDAYPYDTLGAWDYAKDDPDNHFGGPIDASKVGLFGFSKGGFTSLNAFGLEGQIRGLWEDGSPSEPKTVFEYSLSRTLESFGLGFLTTAVAEPAWFIIWFKGRVAGVDLEKHLPSTSLPQGPDTARPVYLVQNLPDTTVPESEAQAIYELLQKYPKKYRVANFWLLDDLCRKENHCTNHLSNFLEYKYRLCAFWARTFHLGLDVCLDHMKATKVVGHKESKEEEA